MGGSDGDTELTCMTPVSPLLKDLFIGGYSKDSSLTSDSYTPNPILMVVLSAGVSKWIKSVKLSLSVVGSVVTKGSYGFASFTSTAGQGLKISMLQIADGKLIRSFAKTSGSN